MFASEVEDLLDDFPHAKKGFLGVKAIDEVKKIAFREKTFAVINVDKVSAPGSHWFCVNCRRTPSRIEIIDSLGTTAEFVHRHFGWSDKCHYNTVALQPRESKACGKFSVYAGLIRLANENLSFTELINSFFTGDLEKNEENVNNFFERNELRETD